MFSILPALCDDVMIGTMAAILSSEARIMRIKTMPQLAKRKDRSQCL